MPQQTDLLFSEPEWRDLFEHLPCGLLITHADGSIIYANNTLLNLLSYGQGELENGRSFQDLLSIGGKVFYQTHHAPLMSIQSTVNELNYDFVCKDGSRIPVMVNSSQKRAGDGSITAIHFAIFPFSDRKKYERELLSAKRKAEIASNAKSLFLSTVSHEVKTPLHAIIGSSDFLLREHPRPDQEELLKVMRVSAQNLMELVNDILDLNKMEAGQLVLEERSFSLHELLDNIILGQKTKAQEKGIALRLSLPDEMEEFYLGDPVKIGQVLTNLVSNAVKFTREGFVEVKVASELTFLKKVNLFFSVVDTGIGIREENLLRIFDPFIQADNTIQNEFGGTGLGLAISQKILNAYGSELKVKSKIGEGSNFSFMIRLKIADSVEIQSMKGRPEEPLEIIPGLKVLVVDDVNSNLIIAKRYLENWGIQSDQATNGKEALEKIRENDYDLVLMDLKMPVMDGFETSRHVRSLSGEKYQNLPIIALSASMTNEITTAMKNAGINDLVNKPFNPAHLHQVIRKYQTLKVETKNDGKGGVAGDFTRKDDLRDLSDSELDLTEIHKTFGNDKEAVHHYFKAVIFDLKIIIETFSMSFYSLSKAQFQDAAHKAGTLIRMFHLHQLQSRINEGNQLLMEDRKEDFVGVLNNIISDLNSFLKRLETETKR